MQEVRFDLALDEVVLGTGSHRLGARLGLGESGQDDHGCMRGQRSYGGERGDARHVRQVQIEEDAVGLAVAQFGAGLGQRGASGQLEAQPCVVEEFFDEQGIAQVVLDEEDAVVGRARGRIRSVVHGCGHRAASAFARVASGRADGRGLCDGSGARVNVIRVPLRYSGSTVMVPPWNSTIFLHMARPMPLPL